MDAQDEPETSGFLRPIAGLFRRFWGAYFNRRMRVLDKVARQKETSSHLRIGRLGKQERTAHPRRDANLDKVEAKRRPGRGNANII